MIPEENKKAIIIYILEKYIKRGQKGYKYRNKIKLYKQRTILKQLQYHEHYVVI